MGEGDVMLTFLAVDKSFPPASLTTSSQQPEAAEPATPNLDDGS
jgi:hypothetical protein